MDFKFENTRSESDENDVSWPDLLGRFCRLSVHKHSAFVAKLARERSPPHEPAGLQEKIKTHG